LTKNGKRNEIGFTRSEVSQIANTNNATFTHNHPNGGSFSTSDLQAAADMNLDEMRAVTKDTLYVIRRPSGERVWPASGDKIAFELEQQGVDLAPKYSQLIKSGAMTPEKATLEWGHEACKNTATAFGFYYERF
jgi:hypothetical protein